MADLLVEGDQLVLRLTKFEKAEAVHGDLSVPLSSVKGLSVLDDAHAPADTGFKFGARLPGSFEAGTFRTRGHKIFAVVHHDTPRGIRVDLEEANHDEWIVGCSDPESVIASIDSAR